MFQITRDKNNRKLEQEVFSKLNDVYDTYFPKRLSDNTINDTKFIGVEDAIKELLKMQNETVDQK